MFDTFLYLSSLPVFFFIFAYTALVLVRFVCLVPATNGEAVGAIVPCGTINDTSFIFFRAWLSSGASRVG